MAEGTRPKLPQNQIEENDFSVDEKLGDLHDELTADTSVTKDDFVSKVKKYLWNFSDIFAVKEHCLNKM